jgi:Sulfotransferase family
MSTEAPTFVFVLGTGRCGSSLVHEVIARHPDVGFVSNIDDRLRTQIPVGWATPLYRRLPTRFTQKGRIRIAPSEGYRILDALVSPAISAPARDLVAEDATPWLSSRFRGFFERQARTQGGLAFVHKFTGWPRARFIDAVLPSVRFVHVIRDGRAVANSLLQMPWWRGYQGPDAWGWGRLPEGYEKEWEASDRSFPVLAAIQWKILMDAFDRAKQEIPASRWFEVRFEDFIDDPVGRTRDLLAFTGLTWTDAFGRNFRHHVFDTTRSDAFRSDLRPADVEQIEGVLGEHLERLGYLDAVGGEGITR